MTNQGPLYTSYKLAVQVTKGGTMYVFDCLFPPEGWRNALDDLFEGFDWELSTSPIHHIELVGHTKEGAAYFLVGDPNISMPSASAIVKDKSLLAMNNATYVGLKRMVKELVASKNGTNVVPLHAASTSLGAAPAVQDKPMNYDDFPVVFTI